jgi:hypothetical protein
MAKEIFGILLGDKRFMLKSLNDILKGNGLHYY